MAWRWPFGWGSKTEIAPVAQDDGVERIAAADLTYANLLRYVGESGDSAALGYYTLSGGGALFKYPTFARCVYFIAGSIANLMSDPESLMVLDTEGRLARSRRSKYVADLLTYSADQETSSYEWIESFASDYVVNGNALARVDRRDDGTPYRLVRLRSDGAETMDTPNGVVYRANEITTDRQVMVPEADIIHVKWPMAITSNWSGGSRSRFAPSPVTLLRPATEVGLASDEYIRAWFSYGGNKSDQAIVWTQHLDDSAYETYKKRLKEKKPREPMILSGGPDVKSLQTSAQNSDTAQLREFQIREVARYFGVPPSVLGEGSTDKAATKAEEIGRIAWRFGLQQHINRFLYAMSYKMLAKGERLDVDPIHLVRGDPASMAPLFTVMRTGPNGTGDMTRTEARRYVGLPANPRRGDELAPERTWPEDQPSQQEAPPAERVSTRKMNGTKPSGIILEESRA